MSENKKTPNTNRSTENRSTENEPTEFFNKDGKPSFNASHPELLDGEEFVANMTKEIFDIGKWAEVGARLGEKAYTFEGRLIPTSGPNRTRPCFVPKRK